MIEPTSHISFPIGPVLLVRNAFTELGLESVFGKLKSKGRSLVSLVEGMISSKIIGNFSVSDCSNWMNQPEMLEFYNLKTFTPRTLYRALETIGENTKDILSFLRDTVFSRLNIDSTDSNLDWTSLVIWGDKSELGERGYSRDHRPDKKQIVIGVAELANPYHIPIGLTVKPGNINDMSHFASTLVSISKWLKKDSLIVCDKGVNSEKNIDLVEALGHSYLMGMRLNKSLEKVIKSFWEKEPVCINPDENSPDKKIWGIAIHYEKHTTYLYFSREREILELAAEEKKAYENYEEARDLETRVRLSLPIPRNLRLSKNPLIRMRYSIQTLLGGREEDEIIADLKCNLHTGREGFFALKTNGNLSPSDALKMYREKDSVEKLFQSLKNEINLKPLRVWTENSMRGAILIGFIAQLIVSLIRYLVPEVKHLSTKYFLKELKKLTVTLKKRRDGFDERIFSNFTPINTAILRSKFTDYGGGTT